MRSWLVFVQWKTTGDGGSGQGFMSFKYLPELMGCKINRAALGGVTLIAVADEEKSARGEHEATMNIAFGQGASNGELGLGFDQPRSATKPQRCEPLDGLAILDVAGGQNTTFCECRHGHCGQRLLTGQQRRRAQLRPGLQ